MDIAKYNRDAWDKQVEKHNRWTVPVSSETIQAARVGDWEIVLTPMKPIPKSWFGELPGKDVLCLASGGGQQSPILAAAGGNVTSYDNSAAQLKQDQLVADRDGLALQTLQGDMRDLSALHSDSFDLIFNPCSVCFIPDVAPMFREAHRVLRPGGRLLCGFSNPARFIFDELALEQGDIRVRHRLPYTDETHLMPEEIGKYREDSEPFVFSHSLEDLITGQLRAGFQLTDLYEDTSPGDIISEFLPLYLATHSTKPA